LVARLLSAEQEEPIAMQQFIQEVSREAIASLTADEANHLLFNGHLPLSWMGLVRYHRKHLRDSVRSPL
jgi:hypothetical protein